ncbi:hypothetical protein [Microbacterium bovistercoris]|nr:hypothetical protein [Microbacterium bovistercoris]
MSAPDDFVDEPRQPTFDEWLARVRLNASVDAGDAAVELLRNDRDAG